MLSNAKFVLATILVSIMLLSLIAGTACLALTNAAVMGTGYTSPTTFWVYAAISWAITFVLAVILLYGAYCWVSCMPPPDCPKPSRRKSACAY